MLVLLKNIFCWFHFENYKTNWFEKIILSFYKWIYRM